MRLSENFELEVGIYVVHIQLVLGKYQIGELNSLEGLPTAPQDLTMCKIPMLLFRVLSSIFQCV